MLGQKEDEAQAELPFVGRDAELAALTLAVNGARVRQQQVVELIGEPGIGKSRLLDELKKMALGFTQLRGRCDQYSSASAYSVFRDLLRPLVGLTPEMDAREAGANLMPWIAAVMPDLAPLAPLIAVPFDAEVPSTPEVDELDPQFRRDRLHECVGTLLMRVLLMPTLLIIEDGHWIDDASRDLAPLADARAGTPALARLRDETPPGRRLRRPCRRRPCAARARPDRRTRRRRRSRSRPRAKSRCPTRCWPSSSIVPAGTRSSCESWSRRRGGRATSARYRTPSRR